MEERRAFTFICHDQDRCCTLGSFDQAGVARSVEATFSAAVPCRPALQRREELSSAEDRRFAQRVSLRCISLQEPALHLDQPQFDEPRDDRIPIQ